MKSLYIRCSEETYKLAHSLAKHENRSLNKQIIHMIHSLAEEKNLEDLLNVYDKATQKALDEQLANKNNREEATVGLSRLVETKKQESDFQ